MKEARKRGGRKEGKKGGEEWRLREGRKARSDANLSTAISEGK